MDSTLFVSVECRRDTYNVGYVDIGNKQGQIVLCLHGVPGQHSDFESLFKPLTEYGARVIVPNLPGFGITENRDCDHTLDEHLDIVQNFMKALRLDSVDIVVSHSAGAWLGTAVAAACSNVRSAVFFAPCGLTPHRAARPIWSPQLLSKCLRFSWIRWLMAWPVRQAYARAGFSTTDINQMFSAVKTVGSLDFSMMPCYAEQISARQLPLFFAWTHNDRLVEPEIPQSMCDAMGVERKNIHDMNADGTTVTPFEPFSASEQFQRGLVFPRGGHYPHRVHTAIISSQMIELLKYLKKSKL